MRAVFVARMIPESVDSNTARGNRGVGCRLLNRKKKNPAFAGFFMPVATGRDRSAQDRIKA